MANEEQIPRLQAKSGGSMPPEKPVRLTAGETPDRADPVPLQTPVSPPESAKRLETTSRTSFSGRSQEPDIEEILFEPEETVVEVEDEWHDKPAASSTPWNWLALIGVTIVGAIGWSLWQLSHGEEKIRSSYEKAEAGLQEERDKTQQAEELVTRIETALKAYFAAGSAEQLLPFVRQPNRVRERMAAWYLAHPFSQDSFRSLTDLAPLPFDERGSFWRARVRLASGKTQEIYVEELPDGTVKVAWESHVGYQPMPWDEFVRNRPAGALDFRLFVQEDHFFSHEFVDSNHWACFRLTAPASEEVAYGYVERGSELAALLEEQCRLAQGRKARLILRLNASPGLNSPRGLLIDSLRSPRWIYLQNPDGGS